MKRSFFLGSEWLYYKIYAGINVQEKILKKEIFELVNALYEEEIIDKFFFIRYQDEIGHHLRLRFHFKDISLYPKVIDRMHGEFANYLENRVIYLITTDVYKRELERYGMLNIENVENMFSLDSWNILSYLHNEEKKWYDIISLIDGVFDCFGLSNFQRQIVSESLFQGFNKRASGNEPLKKHINNIQRLSKNEILFSMENSIWKNQSYSDRLRPYRLSAEDSALNISKNFLDHLDDPDFMDMIKSIIHMSFNRFFSLNQNMYELVVYNMMSKFYKTASIMEKRNTK